MTTPVRITRSQPTASRAENPHASIRFTAISDPVRDLAGGRMDRTAKWQWRLLAELHLIYT